MKFPQTFRNEDGAEIVAINEIQVFALVSEGFKPVEDTKKKPAASN